MTTCFDRWEKDPFFSSAEEVQESADRLESVYRRWIHESKDAPVLNRSGGAEDSSMELLSELRTALGTAKWQLEEFAKAVRSNDKACSAGDGTRARHDQFVSAIENKISEVEISLLQCNRNDRETKLTWVQLDEGERDELALFLSLPSLPKQENLVAAPAESQSNMNVEGEHRKCIHNLDEISRMGGNEKVQGHRRIVSASGDIGSWKISLSPEDGPCRSSEESIVLPPHKVPSLSCLMKAIESTSNVKLSKNGFRKWKGHDHHQPEELIPLRNNSQDTNVCYEKSKSWLNCSGAEDYNKQFYGWLGAFNRQLQRSQYHIQYGRLTQIFVSAIFVILFLVFLVVRAI
ncbi:uncharacterized protein LOC135640465 [Musa acuminata AAA Group]|uniref:uncharacterized protein LOC135640465 n=1 Tax=Musa acuminata AAA Group TaxID=214697 RepID=UPI0031D70974